jgi:membrane associated rhomboid family serine protease
MHSRPDITRQWRQTPVTISILAISAVVFALMSLFGDAIILDWLAFNKVEFNGRRFELVSPGNEYWRYVTPALIHFGLLHILFNYNEGMTMASQVQVQIVGVVATFVYTAIISYFLLKLVDKLLVLRVDEEQELQGVDLVEHDEKGYDL